MTKVATVIIVGVFIEISLIIYWILLVVSSPYGTVTVPMVDWLIIFEPVIVCCLSAGLHLSGRKDRPSELTAPALPVAKVLIICPYCGAKNEQGILKCQKCKADL